MSQTYPNIEYLVVDGASTDATVAIARTVASEFPGRIVRIASEPDRGISDAMNKGIARARGDLICHLHAGDRFADQGVVDSVVSSRRSTNWRWAVASAAVVDANGSISHVYRPAPDCRKLLVKNSIAHQSTFMTRDVFHRYGGFRVDLDQAMDYEYWVRIGLIGGETYAVLPFISTYFLEGGTSSRIFQLLPSLARLRSEFRHRRLGNSRIQDFVFLARVAAFWAVSRALQLTRFTARRARATDQRDSVFL